jgi:hypothetical protein
MDESLVGKHRDVVAVLCRHPLLPADQVAALLKVADGEAQGLLAALQGMAFVESVCCLSPFLPGRPFYLPTSNGLYVLAQLLGVTPEICAGWYRLSQHGLLAALNGLESLYERRAFFLALGAGLAKRGWELRWEVDTPLPYRIRDGAGRWKLKHHTPQGHGVILTFAGANTPSDGDRDAARPFFLIWDRGETQVHKRFWQRVRICHEWLARGEYASDAGCFPLLVIVTTSHVRAREWAWLLKVFPQWRVLKATIATRADIGVDEGFSSLLHPVWRSVHQPEIQGVELINELPTARRVAYEQVNALPYPAPGYPDVAGQEDASDSGDLGPTLESRVWSWEPLKGEAGELAAALFQRPAQTQAVDFFRRYCRRDCQPSLAVLREEYVAIMNLTLEPLARTLLVWLDHHPLLDTAALATFLNVQPETVEHHLAELLTRGLVIRFPSSGAAADPLWHLSPVGLYLQARQAGLNPVNYVRRHAMSARKGALPGEPGNVVIPLAKALRHTTAQNAFFARLVGQARERSRQEEPWKYDARGRLKPGFRPRYGLYVWDSEIRARRVFPRHGKWWVIRPDSYAVIWVRDAHCDFFLEWDMGTCALARYDRKFAYYYRYYESLYQHGERHFPLVLVVTTPRRVQAVGEAVFVAGRVHAGEVPLWITTIEEVQEHGPMAPIWRESYWLVRRREVAPTCFWNALAPPERGAVRFISPEVLQPRAKGKGAPSL